MSARVIIAAVVVTLWLTSSLVMLRHSSGRGFDVEVSGSAVSFLFFDPQDEWAKKVFYRLHPGLNLWWNAPQFRWIPGYESVPHLTVIAIPLWPVGAAGLLWAAWPVVVRARRRKMGGCIDCGYKRVAGRNCAQCGTPDENQIGFSESR